MKEIIKRVNWKQNMVVVFIVAACLFLSVDQVEIMAEESVAYTANYAYDCQRSPAFPAKGDAIRLHSFKKPLAGALSSSPDSAGKWELISLGKYDSTVHTESLTDSIGDIVTDMAEVYRIDAAEVDVFALKKDGNHVCQGVVAATFGEDGVFFIGTSWSGGAGYYLCNRGLNSSDTINTTVDSDCSDLSSSPIQLMSASEFQNAIQSMLGTNSLIDLSSINSIAFESTNGVPDGYVLSTQNLADSEGELISCAYKETSVGSGIYDVVIFATNGVNAPEDLSEMFGGFSGLTSLDLSGITIGSGCNTEGMLEGMNALLELKAPQTYDATTNCTLPETFGYVDDKGSFVDITELSADASGKVLSKKFTVSYYMDENTAMTDIGPNGYYYGYGINNLPENVTRKGYSFEGWYTNSDFSGDPVTSIGSSEVGNETYYAKWSKLSAEAPELTIVPTGATYGYADGKAKVTVSIIERDGYTYAYQWYENTTNTNNGGTAISGANSTTYVLLEGTDAGDYYYYCVVTATRTDNKETAMVTSDVATVTIAPKRLAQAMVAMDATGEYIYTGTAITPVITVTDGIVLVEERDYEVTGDTTKTAYGNYASVVTGKGNYTGTVEIAWNIKDTTAPIGTIEVAKNNWNSLLNSITFDLFYKEEQSVIITGDDGEGQSGVGQIFYYLSKTLIDNIGDLEWIEYNGSFTIDPDNRYIVYAKIIDMSGNVTYLSSNGLVLDATAPVISGISTGKEYCVDTSFTVSDAYLDTVTVNGTPVVLDDGSYTLVANGKEYIIVATDKAGNSTSVIVMMKDGHDWSAEWLKDETGHWHKCTMEGCTEVTKAEAHEDADGDYACDDCGYVLHTHELELVPGKAASCTEGGYKDYYKCVSGECDRLFADEAGNNPITIADVKLSELGHDWSGKWTIIKEATETEEGKKEMFCAKGCGQKKVVKIPLTEDEDENGNLEKDVEIEKDVLIEEVTLNNSKTEFLGENGIFTEIEKEEIQNGADARVWIEISKTDELAIAPEDKKEIENEVKNAIGEKVPIHYCDIDLYKQVGNGAKIPISESNVAIQIAIVIPEVLQNKDDSIVREYKIVRLHEGKVEIIDGIFDPITKEFLFESDQFSTYAIIYKDTAKVEPETPEVPETPSVPETSDKTNGMLFVLLFVAGYIMIVCAGKQKGSR